MQQTRIIATRRFFSICIILMLIFSLIPAMPAAAEVLDFETAMESIEAGGTIDLKGQSYMIGTQTGKELDPYIFKKKVTITDSTGGGNLTVWKSGLLLEADVTFKDVKLTLANSNRNAVFANGYTLTMENVIGGSREINLFAGNAYAIQSNLTTKPFSENSGDYSKIVLRGTNSNFGNIYGGSMNGNFDYDVELNLSGSFNGNVFACGAIQSTVDDNKWFDINYQPERPDIQYYRFLVKGDVNIKLSNSSVTNIDGLADSTWGYSKAAIVECQSDYEKSNLSMKNIGGLSVLSGGALKPVSMNSGIPVSVAEGATLNLSTVAASGENSGIFSLGDFYGGGTVVLGKDQTLNIFGNVSGTTKLAIDSHLFPKDARDDGHVYISAPASADGAFHLLPSTTQTGKDFVRNDKGEWSVPSQTSGIDISGASIKVTDDPETLICVPGGVVEPNIEVYLDGKKLGSEYYEVTYYGNNLPGEASIGIKGKNGYTGTAYKRFDILPADVTDTKYTQAAYTVSAKGETKTVTLPDLPHEEMEYAQPRDGNGNMTLTDLKVEDPAQADGKYQLSFTAPSGSEGQVGKIIVPVKVKNPIGIDKDYSEFCPYRNYELTATFTAVGDTQTELTIIGVALEPKTYDGSAPATVKSVEFSGLKNGDSLTVDTDYTVKASFDNFNAGENKTVTVTVTLIDKPDYVLINSPYTLTGQTITKATPSVKPEYEKITAYGKTLADARLTKGSTYVEGTICWVGDDDKPLDNSTVVLKDKNYKWRFTPNDNENYNIVEKTVVLYLSGSGSGGGTGGGGSGGGGGGGGAAAPTVQRPTIEAGEGAKVTLSADGTTATITAAEGYEITDVTLNGVSKGTAAAVSGLKTGDKLTVTAAKKSGAITEEDQKKAEAITGFKPSAKSILTKTKSGKKAIRITWTKSEYDFDGVEVWRSTKKNSGYGKKPMWTIKAKNTKNYYNTAIKKGKTYYYKLRGYVEINGQKYYTPFSNKVYRTVK